MNPSHHTIDPMQLTLEIGHRAGVLKINGRLDLAASRDVRGLVLWMAEAQLRLVAIDLCDLSLIDSSGIAVLLDGRERAQKRGAEFKLINVPPPILDALDSAGLREVFTVVPA